MWMRGAASVVALAVGMSLLAGCGGGATKKPVATAKVSPSPTPAPYTYPLTGLPSGKEVTTRPIMVMVENSPAARPQSGLNKADIVYEILAEGNITRFITLYQSQSAAKIGPVRSTRVYFAQIAEGWQGALFHCGGAAVAINYLQNRKIRHLDQIIGGSKYFWRTSDRKAPHNLYTKSSNLQQALADKGWDDKWAGTGYTYSKTPATSAGQTANELKLQYLNGYYAGYKWDAKKSVYVRNMEGVVHKDRETGEPLVANNVIVMVTSHHIYDYKGRREVDMKGPGKGYLAQAGKLIPVNWVFANGHIQVYDHGHAYTMLPGKTWIQVVQSNSDVSWK